MSNLAPPRSTPEMVNRGDIVWLGIGMDLIVNGQPLGWVLMLPGAPVSAVPGWLLGRRLAREL